MDELDFIALLPQSGYRSEKERYNEFRKLFMGSDEGQRVFKEILSWGRLFQPSILTHPPDQIAMNIREGERNLALKLLKVVNSEPPEKPEKTVRRKNV